MPRDPLEIRERLAATRLLLLFTPQLCAGDPLAALEAALPWCGTVQIRPKPLGAAALASAPCEARTTFDLCRRVLALDSVRRLGVLVTVNDRVDVARALWDEGCAGVHVGQDDCPIDVARAFLGEEPLLGLSTHSLEQVGEAAELPIDCAGFGPVRATPTKGYAQGLGPEAAWIAASALGRPLFPIGGIDRECAQELSRVGRAAVGSAILSAPDPERAARELFALLEGNV